MPRPNLRVKPGSRWRQPSCCLCPRPCRISCCRMLDRWITGQEIENNLAARCGGKTRFLTWQSSQDLEVKSLLAGQEKQVHVRRGLDRERKDLATPVRWARRTYVPRESKFSALSSPRESLAGTKSSLRPRLGSLDSWMLLFAQVSAQRLDILLPWNNNTKPVTSVRWRPVVVSLPVLAHDPAILRYHILLQHVFRWNFGPRRRHTVLRRESMPRTKNFPRDFYQRESSPSRMPWPLCMAGATFLLILLQLRSPRTPEKRNTSGTRGQCVPTPHVGRRLPRTLYLHNLIRSGKLEPFGAGELSRTVWHCSSVACAGRMVGGRTKTDVGSNLI